MKKTILIAALLLSGSAFAESPKPTEENFKDIQTKVLQVLDKRQVQITKEQACVRAAQDRDGLKACRVEARQDHEKMRGEMRDNFDRQQRCPVGMGSQRPSQGPQAQQPPQK